jgi:hypothetical protein
LAATRDRSVGVQMSYYYYGIKDDGKVSIIGLYKSRRINGKFIKGTYDIEFKKLKYIIKFVFENNYKEIELI